MTVIPGVNWAVRLHLGSFLSASPIITVQNEAPPFPQMHYIHFPSFNNIFCMGYKINHIIIIAFITPQVRVPL